MSNYTLELFNGREYEPVPHHMVCPFTLAEIGRDLVRLGGFSGFRVVKPGHKYPARVKRWRPTPSRAYARDRDAVRDQYLAWAQARELQRVTVYRGDDSARIAALESGVPEVCEVDPADFIGPAPAAELDEA